MKGVQLIKNIAFIILVTVVSPGVIYYLVLREPSPPTVEFKGVEMGATENEVLKAFPTAICWYYPRPSSTKEVDRCKVESTTIAETPAEAVFFFVNNRVIEIAVEFPADNYETVIAAVAEKYGEPYTSGDKGEESASWFSADEYAEDDITAERVDSFYPAVNRSVIRYARKSLDGQYFGEENRKARDL